MAALPYACKPKACRRVRKTVAPRASLCKEVEMNLDKIEVLIGKVSPDLLVRYQTNNAVDLKLVLEQVKSAEEGSKSNRRHFLVYASFIILAAFLLLVCGVVFEEVSWLVAFVLIEIFCGISVYRALERHEKDIDSLQTHCSTLEEFDGAVTALNPFAGEVACYDEPWVRSMLVILAAEVLHAEAAFQGGCMSKKATSLDVTQLGSKVLEVTKKFRNAISAAQKFGLKFKNANLFSDAKKYFGPQAAQP